MIGYSAKAAGVGAPDAMTGHGYGSTKDSAANKTRSMGRGFPYNRNDLMPDDHDCDCEDYDCEDCDCETCEKVVNTTLGDPARTDFGFTQRGGNRSLGTAGVSESSLIRLRPKSSEPFSTGMKYGLSRAPIWPEPRRKGVDNPRFDDVVQDDEEAYEDHMDFINGRRVDEQLLRRYIRHILYFETNNF